MNLEKRNLKFPGRTRRQPVHLGSLPRCFAQIRNNFRVHVSGRLPETTGWQPVSPETTALRTPHVGACACVDLDRFAFLNEKWDVDCLSGLQLCRLGDVAGGVAADAFR